MSKPRIHILALGGTIATRPDASGVMQMGLGADDLVTAVPLLGTLAEIEAETVSRVGSHSLSFDQIHALAAKIAALKADGVSSRKAPTRWRRRASCSTCCSTSTCR